MVTESEYSQYKNSQRTGRDILKERIQKHCNLCTKKNCRKCYYTDPHKEPSGFRKIQHVLEQWTQ